MDKSLQEITPFWMQEDNTTMNDIMDLSASRTHRTSAFIAGRIGCEVENVLATCLGREEGLAMLNNFSIVCTLLISWINACNNNQRQKSSYYIFLQILEIYLVVSRLGSTLHLPESWCHNPKLDMAALHTEE